jgi:LysM repeat protein
LLALLVVALAAALFLALTGRLKLPGQVAAAGPTQASGVTSVAPTPTLQPTFTPTATATETQAPTATPQAPLEHTVVAGDTCVGLALKYNVSTESIITLNRLDPNCSLSLGQRLLIPQPTPTPTPYPTATLGAAVSTDVPRLTYTIHAGDTLAGIANFYGVTINDLMEVNGITDANSIRPGQVLIIPVERAVTPGPTPTPTQPAPWPAPNPLLPVNGQVVAASDETVTLQWTAVGTLRPNEYYYVVIEDVTCNCARFHRQATTDTKLIVPATFRPSDASTHIYFWTVTTMRDLSASGNQSDLAPAGATSGIRAFSWAGGSAP